MEDKDEDIIKEIIAKNQDEYPITYHGNMVTVTSKVGVLMCSADMFHNAMQKEAKKYFKNLKTK